jgi:hypothetical protein
MVINGMATWLSWTERLKMNTLGCFVDGKQLLVEADIMLGDRAW